MDNQKKNILIGVLVGIIFILVVFLIFRKEEVKTFNNGNENNEIENEIIKEKKYNDIDFDELVKNLKEDDKKYETSSSYEKNDVIELPKTLNISYNNKEYIITIDSDGVLKVNDKILDTEDSHALIDTALDVASISNEYNSKIFVLMTDGDVYEYSLENFDKGNTSIKRIDEVRDAYRFVKITKCYKEAGCDMLLGVIDKKNQYIEIDSFAV